MFTSRLLYPYRTSNHGTVLSGNPPPRSTPKSSRKSAQPTSSKLSVRNKRFMVQHHSYRLASNPSQQIRSRGKATSPKRRPVPQGSISTTSSRPELPIPHLQPDTQNSTTLDVDMSPSKTNFDFLQQRIKQPQPYGRLDVTKEVKAILRQAPDVTHLHSQERRR